MDQFKRSIFTSRLCVYNETFTHLGTNAKKPKDKTIVWHEAIAGRRDEDVSSSFHNFLLSFRDAESITMWLDNCSAQNKNWTFLSMIKHTMQKGSINAQEVNLKYFEPGHSFMVPDSTHSKLERSLGRQQGKIFDFNDLLNTFELAGCDVVPLNAGDFTDWESGVSQYSLTKAGTERPHLAKMCWIKFLKGEDQTFMSFKTDYDQFDFRPFNHWKVKFAQNTDPRVQPRGISKTKKDNIVSNALQSKGILAEPPRKQQKPRFSPRN